MRALVPMSVHLIVGVSKARDETGHLPAGLVETATEWLAPLYWHTLPR